MEKLWRKLSELWPRNLREEPYIQHQFNNLRLLGIYPGFSKAPYWRRLGLYAMELFCVLQTVAIACDLLDSREDIERFGDDLCVLMSLKMVLVKRWFCRFYLDDLLEFVKQLRELYRHREQQYMQQVLSHHRLEWLIVHLTYILGSVLTVSLVLYGLFSDGFILRAKYPFSNDTIIGYGVIFVSQMVLACHSIMSVTLTELFICQLVSQLSLYFQLLGMEFATIGTERSAHGRSLCRDETVVARIRQLILRHQYLLELGNQVTEVLEPNLMGQFIASIILICTSAFEVLFAKGNLILIFRCATFVLCVLYQILTWCFLGDLVAQKSLSISDGIASCNWIVLDSRQKKDLSLIMMRAQKPYTINVYRMFPLTYETFLAILGRAYSAFTVMTEMIE